MDLWTREARLFKYGSGTGTNFSKLRGENEPLSGGGQVSGPHELPEDRRPRRRAPSSRGGTTRRAAKMVCLDLDHPDIEAFVNWKVREELKVAMLAAGSALPNQHWNAMCRPWKAPPRRDSRPQDQREPAQGPGQGQGAPGWPRPS